MNKIVAMLFAIACFATSWISGDLLGIGLWFWIILASGVFVAISQFIPKAQTIGAGVAGTLGGLSIVAVLFGLVAATAGGSFKSDDGGLDLLFSFFLVAVFGLALVILNKQSEKQKL